MWSPGVHLFATIGRVPRLSKTDLVRMRKSLAMAPQLPLSQIEWLIGEAERLVADRAELEAIVAQLTGPWADVRSALNALAKLAEP
jgi:hypothetical protein